MDTLLIASTNPGKLREMKALLAYLRVKLISPADMGIQLSVTEDGSTYAENAAKKAQAYCQASGLITLADDSGLEVDALEGKPGLYSARFSGKPDATDADRRAYLLEQLAGIAHPWTAHFHCTVVIMSPDGQQFYHEGICPGEIIPTERGNDGFGYDPIFRLPASGKTMAELTMAEKNRLSHRARAILAARPTLERLFA